MTKPTKCRLTGKTAVTTGGAAGIGSVTARMFSREGGRAAMIDILQKAGLETVEAICADGGQAQFFQVDASKSNLVDRDSDAIKAEFGFYDAPFNRA